MLLNFRNLDADTRSLMVEEIDRDIAAGSIHLSNWLTEEGTHIWGSLLREAAALHDDEWLAAQLRTRRLLRSETQVRTPSGGYTMRHVPHEGPEVMTHEFNMFYVRALCRRAIDGHIDWLTIYRAKEVHTPRPESAQLIGSHINPTTTLNDLRNTHGTTPRLGFPAGPNTGLTAMLP